MHDILSKIDELQTSVKRWKKALYAKAHGESGMETGRVSHAATGLRDLQTRLGDLWGGVRRGSITQTFAAEDFHLLELKFEEIVASIESSQSQ